MSIGGAATATAVMGMVVVVVVVATDGGGDSGGMVCSASGGGGSGRGGGGVGSRQLRVRGEIAHVGLGRRRIRWTHQAGRIVEARGHEICIAPRVHAVLRWHAIEHINHCALEQSN